MNLVNSYDVQEEEAKRISNWCQTKLPILLEIMNGSVFSLEVCHPCEIIRKSLVAVGGQEGLTSACQMCCRVYSKFQISAPNYFLLFSIDSL